MGTLEHLEFVKTNHNNIHLTQIKERERRNRLIEKIINKKEK